MVCPHCVLVAVSTVGMFFLAACGSSGGGESAPPAPAPTNPPVTDNPSPTPSPSPETCAGTLQVGQAVKLHKNIYGPGCKGVISDCSTEETTYLVSQVTCRGNEAADVQTDQDDLKPLEE
jgi:hypothetical protein